VYSKVSGGSLVYWWVLLSDFVLAEGSGPSDNRQLKGRGEYQIGLTCGFSMRRLPTSLTRPGFQDIPSPSKGWHIGHKVGLAVGRIFLAIAMTAAFAIGLAAASFIYMLWLELNR
jgi:hypothetical protein